MGGLLTGSPAGRRCRQGISLHVLSLSGQRIGVHRESGTGMSSVSAPGKKGKARCRTCSDGMQRSSMASVAGFKERGILRSLLFIPSNSLPALTLVHRYPMRRGTRWPAGTRRAWVCTSIWFCTQS